LVVRIGYVSISGGHNGGGAGPPGRGPCPAVAARQDIPTAGADAQEKHLYPFERFTERAKKVLTLAQELPRF